MREIKFRAWDKIKKQMYLPEHIESDEFITFTGKVVNPLIHFPEGLEMVEDKYIILMQFTGLHDKNGKEIYEGDIAQTEEFWGGYGFNPPETIINICQICWSQFYCAWVLRSLIENEKETELLADWVSDAIADFEVIGNIYENPELLEQ